MYLLVLMIDEEFYIKNFNGAPLNILSSEDSAMYRYCEFRNLLYTSVQHLKDFMIPVVMWIYLVIWIN